MSGASLTSGTRMEVVFSKGRKSRTGWRKKWRKSLYAKPQSKKDLLNWFKGLTPTLTGRLTDGNFISIAWRTMFPMNDLIWWWIELLNIQNQNFTVFLNGFDEFSRSKSLLLIFEKEIEKITQKIEVRLCKSRVCPLLILTRTPKHFSFPSLIPTI